MQKAPSNEIVWREKIQAWEKSGKSIASWCREKHLTYSTFIYWKQRLGEKKDVFSFVECPRDDSSSDLVVESHLGLRLHLQQNFNEATLRRFLSLLREFV